MKTINRQLNKSQWYEFWQILRRSGHSRSFKIDDAFQHKLNLQKEIAKYQVEGKILLCSRYMDCDCAISTNSSVVPAILVIINKEMDDIVDNAEGPGTIWFDKPTERPPRDFRDLIMEAHEDGHPHVVYH